MAIDIQTQSKLSAVTGIGAAFAAMSVSQILGLISLAISCLAGLYSFYCSRLNAKNQQLERKKKELEIKQLEWERERHRRIYRN